MSKLVPEKRLDKTGKLVTRHVKADDPATSKSKNLPSPSMAFASAEKIVLPEDEVTPMSKKDWNMIADVLDSGGDLDYVLQYIRDGDLETLRVFHTYFPDHSFSLMSDVLAETNALYGEDKPEDYLESIGAHIKIAGSGYFYYHDIAGVPEHEAILQIIHDNVEQVDSILNFLMHREANAEALKTYLANYTKPLRDGTL